MHSPTPWTVQYDSDSDSWTINELSPLAGFLREDNAAFTIRAVHNYDPLVEALEKLLGDAEEMNRVIHDEFSPGNCPNHDCTAGTEPMKQARAVLEATQ